MQTARVELHLHLDGSLNLKWAYDKARQRGAVPSGISFEDFYDLVYANNLKDRSQSIRKFELMCDCLQHADDLYEAAYMLTDTIRREGVWYAEIRFASQQHTLAGLSQLEALEAVIAGAGDCARHFSDIRVGIINCLMHKGDSAAFNMAENLETVRVTSLMQGKGAVGVDLAGFENNCDYSEYAPAIAAAKAAGLPVTMHAGEMGIGAHIPLAIAMGADRLGHGVNCVQDPAWLKQVVDRQIPLEVCVSSNVKKDLNYAAHPVRRLIAEGAKVTLNTDNRIFARTNLPNEHAQMRQLGLSYDELKRCTMNAAQAAFCDDETREWLTERLRREFSL